MPDTTISLGSVVLQRFEVPDRINVGGKQRLAVHRLTDGSRVIDSLGRDDSDIAFRGILSGPDATMRARLLDVLRVAGDPLPLTWDVFYYTVILSDFQADFENRNWIPYRITCTVLRDEASSAIVPSLSLVNAMLSDINTAGLDGSGTSFDFTSLQASLTQAGATTRGTAAYGVAQSDLTAIQLAVAGQIANEEANLQANAVLPTTSTQAALDSLALVSQAAQQIAILTKTRAYLGRAALNLNCAST